MKATHTRYLPGRSTSRLYASVIVCVIAVFSPFLLASCSAQSSLSEDDQRVIAQLTEVAPIDSAIEGQTTEVECWKPSESMLDEDVFRVICRVHYDQAGADRYRDMICIGDISKDPVIDHCYRWAFYTDMPEYDDQPGYVAS